MGLQTKTDIERGGGGHIVVFQFELELRMTHSVIHWPRIGSTDLGTSWYIMIYHPKPSSQSLREIVIPDMI